ncbi:MAG: ABC transporter ATP-binding protein [Ilumatobacter sp.]
MIEVRNITKRFGAVTAVDDLSFDVHPGRVTGFLGPNGSGKSTTMRCMLGLDKAQGGEARFGGRRFAEFTRPLHEVGALLDAGYVHPGRSGRNHLRWMATSNGIDKGRVDAVLEMVGLTDAADRRVKGYSLGMRQRLGLASVLLGDPHTIILDEPANGLDPEGIRWIRDVLKSLAAEGRAVLVSSHLLSEMALMATDLVVIGQGRLVQQGTVAEFADVHSETWVRVKSPELGRLVDVVQGVGGVAAPMDPHQPLAGALVRQIAPERIGELAATNGIVLHELAVEQSSLEDAFLRATASVQEYRSTGVQGHPNPPVVAPPPSSTPGPPGVSPGVPPGPPVMRPGPPQAPPMPGGPQ